LKKCLQTTIKSKNHFLTKLLLERGDPIIDQATVNNALASGDEHILSLLLSGLGCSTPDFAQQNFPPVNSWRTLFRPAIIDQHIEMKVITDGTEQLINLLENDTPLQLPTFL